MAFCYGFYTKTPFWFLEAPNEEQLSIEKSELNKFLSEIVYEYSDNDFNVNFHRDGFISFQSKSLSVFDSREPFAENLDQQLVLDHCRKNLVAYKVPKFVEFRKELPKTNVGKILRRALKEESNSQ